MKNKYGFVIFLCLVLSSLMALSIDAYNRTYAIDRSMSDVPVFMRFLGEGRAIVSNLSILQADRYFHGGAGHFADEHKERFAIVEKDHKVCENPEEHSHATTEPVNILFRVSQEMNVTEHVHLHDDQVKEIIPWLYYAAKIDPQNIQSYTLTGFYLCDRLGKTDQGIAFLREGLEKNPGSWEINAELGRIYFQYVKNYETATRYLSIAAVLLREIPHDKFQERYVLSFLARSYEALGRGKDALPLYRRLNELFPNGVFEEKSRNFPPKNLSF